jgi:DNA (cytosine-5)-methyltransferase 1
MGYHLAGFEVVGVDNRPMPRYPFDFVEGDALEYIAAHGHEFDAIHASPPCQRYSVSTVAFRRAGKQYADLIGPTRTALTATGRPWVMENVPRAPLRPDYILCGCMFPGELPGLRRERWFEVSWGPVAQLRPPCHHPEPIVTVMGHGPGPNQRGMRALPGPEFHALKRHAMGIDWMNREELGEAIPPAYGRWIGEQLAAHVERCAASEAVA